MARRCTLAIAALAFGCGTAVDDRKPAPAVPPRATTPTTSGSVISGAVVDRSSGEAVPGVTVVLIGESGEVSAVTDGGGAFSLSVLPGNYRGFVRDPSWIRVALQDRVRLYDDPGAELMVPDQTLMPIISAPTDLRDLELLVARAAVVTGSVVDANNRKVAGAVLRLRVAEPPVFELRPALATDVAISDATGEFSLRVPAGHYQIEASHPAFAGVAAPVELTLQPGQQEETVVELARGCIISGRVVQADGTPAHDGALEVVGDLGFRPEGRSAPGGTFRWTTIKHGEVKLRAWPWRSPPSATRTFRCRDGKRYPNVVLQLPDRPPELSGVVVDKHGDPVPLAYVDLTALDLAATRLLISQQERADSSGSWQIYDLPPGRYKLEAAAPGRGVVEATVTAPQQGVKLQLGGTGRIAGTTTELVNGSFELSFISCGTKANLLRIAHETRIVSVRGGRFAIDGAPACALSFTVHWRGVEVVATADVEPDRTTHIELPLGVPRDKTVTGTVRDRDAKPVANARVTALVDDLEATTVRCDRSGRYTLSTRSGAALIARDRDHIGHASVGRANVPTERVDVVLDDAQ